EQVVRMARPVGVMSHIGVGERIKGQQALQVCQHAADARDLADEDAVPAVEELRVAQGELELLAEVGKELGVGYLAALVPAIGLFGKDSLPDQGGDVAYRHAGKLRPARVRTGLVEVDDHAPQIKEQGFDAPLHASSAPARAPRGPARTSTAPG